MRIKKSTMQWIIVIAVIVIVLSAGFVSAYFYMLNRYKTDFEEKLLIKDGIINANRRLAYVAKEDLNPGEYITDENVELLEVLSGEPQMYLIDAADLYKALKVEIQAGTYIRKNMVTDFKEESENSRELKLNCFAVTPNISRNDYVDVRIVYPNGETYVVLAKKRVTDFEENMQDCYLWVSPEEIDRIQSAIVDAFIYGGTSIYLTKYLEPSFQEASAITYTPSLQTIALIQSNPNIIQTASDYLSTQVRMELENRIIDSIVSDLREWTVDQIYKKEGDGQEAKETEEDKDDLGLVINDEDYFFNE